MATLRGRGANPGCFGKSSLLSMSYSVSAQSVSAGIRVKRTMSKFKRNGQKGRKTHLPDCKTKFSEKIAEHRACGVESKSKSGTPIVKRSTSVMAESQCARRESVKHSDVCPTQE